MASFIAKFQEALPVVEGENNGKRWCRRTVLVGMYDDTERVIALTVFGESKIDMFGSVQRGQLMKVFYDLVSRECNGRWFTEARVVSAVTLTVAG